MKRSSLLLTFIIFTFSGSASSQEVTLEQAKAQFAAADKSLNAAYGRAKATLAEGYFTDLQADQRDWIEYRDYRSEQAAAFDGRAEEGKEKLNVEYWKSLAAITEERIRIIEGWIKADSFPKDWEGVWSDGQGGWLAILEDGDGTFVFSMNVVRGPTYHVGNIGGPGKWIGSTARITVDPMDGENETWLTFVKRGIKLEVIGENTSYFHGARAYFDGDYIRVSELGEDDRKEILSPEEN